MSHAKSLAIPFMALALDAEKAFDIFLFKVLKRYSLGNSFISWIQFLYRSPQASVRANRSFSQMFQLGSCCRQGDPLLPLSFTLSIEPLAQLLRDSTDINHIEVNGEEHSLSLYADDVIVYIYIYICDPAKSIPNLMKHLETFGLYSGPRYKVLQLTKPRRGLGLPNLKHYWLVTSNDSVVSR